MYIFNSAKGHVIYFPSRTLIITSILSKYIVAVFKIKDVLGTIQGKKLENDNVEERGGMLYARIRKIPLISAGKLTLRWQGYLGKSDPFFVVLRNYEHEDDKAFAPIYRSERMQSNWSSRGSPQWNLASIDVHELCDGDLNRGFHLVVFDHDMSSDANHVHLCHFETTVNKLITSGKGESYKLTKGEGPGEEACGAISVDECEITEADTLSMMNPVDKLQLTLYATGLKNVAGVLKGTSDPYAEVKLLVSGSDEEPGKLLGRTEVIKNALSPKWTTSFIFDHSFGKEACIKVSVVDKVRKGGGIPMGCEYFYVMQIYEYIPFAFAHSLIITETAFTITILQLLCSKLKIFLVIKGKEVLKPDH